MKKKIYISISFILLICFFSCIKSPEKTENTSKIIAKVNQNNLYFDDLKGLVPKGLSKNDSIAFIQTYINKWVYKEVFYQQALNYLEENEKDVSKELDNYKKDLITYIFEKKLIDQKLDTNITDKEIEDYYNQNSQNFLLKSNIVKVLYVKTPVNIPNIEKLKKLCYSNDAKDQEQLKSLCIQYANNYYMNENNTWLMFDDLKNEIYQLKEIPDYEIKNGKTYEFTDATSFYFLKIIDIKSKNTLSPLNFEKGNIKNMLINQRKEQLIDNIRKDFFDKAKTNKELEIYN